MNGQISPGPDKNKQVDRDVRIAISPVNDRAGDGAIHLPEA